MATTDRSHVHLSRLRRAAHRAFPAAVHICPKNDQKGALAFVDSQGEDCLLRHRQLAARANLPGVRRKVAAVVSARMGEARALMPPGERSPHFTGTCIYFPLEAFGNQSYDNKTAGTLHGTSHGMH